MGTFVKKNKLNNSSKWFTFGQKIRPQFQAAVFLSTNFYLISITPLHKSLNSF